MHKRLCHKISTNKLFQIHPKTHRNCSWTSITCNEVGSITEIDAWTMNIPRSKELLQIENINVTAMHVHVNSETYYWGDT